MNAITTGTHGFLVALVATLVVGASVLAGQHLLGVGDDTATSVGTVMRQVDAPAEADDDPSGDVEDGIPVAGSESVGDVVASLEADGLAETLDVYLSRDPFQPVVVQLTSADGGSGDGGGTTDGGTDGGTTIGSNDNGLACTGSGAEAVCNGTVVTMTGFSDDGEALVEVDGATYQVGTGEEFATSFRVERLDQSAGCAFLRYGDEAFTICAGATVLK